MGQEAVMFERVNTLTSGIPAGGTPNAFTHTRLRSAHRRLSTIIASPGERYAMEEDGHKTLGRFPRPAEHVSEYHFTFMSHVTLRLAATCTSVSFDNKHRKTELEKTEIYAEH